MQGHTVPHWKALSRGKYDPREVNRNSTLNICKDILKIVSLRHEWGLGEYQLQSPVDS